MFKAAWVQVAAVAVLAVTAAACDGGGGTPAAARDLVIVTMATSDVQVDVGEQAQLVASGKNGSASAPVESWSSSDPNVASVNASGVVVGVREGDVTVTATYRGATGVATVKVRHKQIAKIVVSPKSVSLGALGDTARLSGAAYDASGTVLPTVIGFSTPDTQVVAVTGDGKVTARGTGLARVIAQSSGKADTCMVSVVQIVAAVALSPTAQTLQTGQSTVLQAAARDSGGAAIAGASFKWASSNAAAVAVDPDGTIHGVGTGSAIVSATGSNGVAGTASVSVQQVPIASLAVSPASVSLTAGGTQQLVAVARDANGNVLTGRVVSWSTSNANVASVSPLGVVFALGLGSATITATSEGKTATAAVTVNAQVTSPITTPALLASADFESGAVPLPFVDPFAAPSPVSVVSDPTGGRGGKVVQLHYANSGGDKNIDIEYYPGAPIRSGSLFFRAYLYVPKPRTAVDAIRKLLYWHNDGHTASQVVWSILYLQGDHLRYDGGNLAHQNGMLIDAGTYNYFDRWVRVEQEVKLNTPGLADGEMRVWLDGVLVINRTGCRWLDTPDDNLGFYQIGQQVHPMSSDDTYDEYRYYDNIAFSTSRIGP